MHQIPFEHWAGIIFKLIERLKDSARVVSKVSFCLHSIADNYNSFGKKNFPNEPSNVFSPLLVTIMENLVAIVDREEWDESSMRSHAFEAIQNFVNVAPGKRLYFSMCLCTF